MNNEHLSQIIKSFHENKLAHAFLIETNFQNSVYTSIKKIIKQINCENEFEEECNKCSLCHLIDQENLPSFIVIKPDGQTIRKEQILNLKKSFSTKPIYSKYNVYVIMNAEKLNSSSANTMLKFLEEPEDHILGFFVTNNKENVIDTIRSRCQVILDYYDDIGNLQLENNKDFQAMAIDYIKEIYCSNEMCFFYNKNQIIPQLEDKSDYQELFQMILKIFYDFYLNGLDLKPLDENYHEIKFLQQKEMRFFIDKIKLIEEIIQESNSNVNNNLLLDRFIIEMR